MVCGGVGAGTQGDRALIREPCFSHRLTLWAARVKRDVLIRCRSAVFGVLCVCLDPLLVPVPPDVEIGAELR